jgi:hypothetical protein
MPKMILFNLIVLLCLFAYVYVATLLGHIFGVSCDTILGKRDIFKASWGTVVGYATTGTYSKGSRCYQNCSLLGRRVSSPHVGGTLGLTIR